MIHDILLKILSYQARRVIQKFSPQIIAITGSSGKSSTRDAVYSVLALSGRVRKSARTDDMFSPLCTILGISHPGSNPFKWIVLFVSGFFVPYSKKEYPRFLILEISAFGPDSIRSLAGWMHPSVTIVSSFGDVPPHVEYFDSIESLRDEKGALVTATREGGIVVLNQDDGSVAHFAGYSRVPIKTFGLVLADVSAKKYAVEWKNGVISGISFDVISGKQSTHVVLDGCLGTMHAYPVLAAISTGIHFGLSLEKISEAFRSYTPPAGRIRLIPGIKDSLIVDDSSGSSPMNLHESLVAIKELARPNGRKILVLGDMLLLGKHTAHAHIEAGKQSGFADILITVGFRSRLIAEGALQAGLTESIIFQVDTKEEAGKILQQILKPDDTVLVKGDKSIGLVSVVEEVMLYPERVSEFLDAI